MKKLNRANILKGAGVLLIIAVMVLSSTAVIANTTKGQTLNTRYSKLSSSYTPQIQTNIEEIVPSSSESRDTILFESFEDTWVADSDGDLAPPGWENHITNPGDTGDPSYLPWHWGQYGTVTSYDPPAVPPDGDYQAMVHWDYGHQDEWLITPELNLADYSGCELIFWRYGHTGSTHLDHYYVMASPSAGFDQSDFTDILWDASELPEGDNHYDTPYIIDLSAYDGTSIRIAWNNVDGPTNDGLWFGSCIDVVEVTGGSGGAPDLNCDGSLSWDGVKPSATVTGSFIVENIGDPCSLLDWEITEWPDWGNWTFTPSSGDDLTPEDGPVTVDVEVAAPDEPETEFTGEVKIINSEDPDDYCIINVSLATPVNQEPTGLFSWVFLRGLVFNPRESDSSISARALNLHYIEITPTGISKGVVRLKKVSFRNGPFIKLSERGLLGNAVRVSGFCHGGIEI